MKIFIHKQGQTLGPYSVEEVQSRIARSELSPADLAWQEGTRDWQPLTSLIGMGRSNAGLPPPIPPAPVRYAGFWRRVVGLPQRLREPQCPSRIAGQQHPLGQSGGGAQVDGLVVRHGRRL